MGGGGGVGIHLSMVYQINICRKTIRLTEIILTLVITTYFEMLVWKRHESMSNVLLLLYIYF